MEVHQLRYVCAIAETGSFSRAAERCQVAQPSLSQQISKLEDELGTRLFDRLARSVRLTDAGRTFLPHARTILHETELARSEVDGRRRDARGTVIVGVIPTIAPYYLPQRITEFHAEVSRGDAARRGGNDAGAAGEPAQPVHRHRDPVAAHAASRI